MTDVVHRHPGWFGPVPIDQYAVDQSLVVTDDPGRQFTDDLVERRLDAGQFPLLDALHAAGTAGPLRIGDGAAQEESLVARRESSVVARFENLLR